MAKKKAKTEKPVCIEKREDVCTKEEAQAIAQASYRAGVFCGMIKMWFYLLILYILISCFRREE